ncbi:MAG: formate dehydrogenase accessory sulfurtransferase FdhD [Candidatus Margulisiibacteriota bacterium]|nr:MAG: formate dehydrogenase family accessory protein FdhD [Candidatus Margulisbacteria bacterium GWD2_39_127]OGI05593.1 MAG: formate dehydrogenase family accessory protein FdhD [Candidatus Margulisbacteria bacterium GWF2_38_17]OGI07550.1 MAG: formate dehydrogenase family accessory protein FdhD [Candidatus Margulisbacteria bacterium GWE2_39_32]PZM84881.1 MAG: formate dehydrogenase accessory sulfurtransferase FdhD [Candidatus Margulisiibacteriota bacterium]HAR64033.1 formate dehydrogenase acces
MDENIYLELPVTELSKDDSGIHVNLVDKQVISEISLKLIINGEEFVSLLCLNQFPEELALGFLYNEGFIDSFDDVAGIYFNERMFAVIIQLKDGLVLNTQENLRSITSGCGKGLTYINPLKTNNFSPATSPITISISRIWEMMKNFNRQSEIYTVIGGVHSVLFQDKTRTILNEDIGRHNCVDKITGILLKENRIKDATEGILFSSGRISSEIMTKIVRLNIPVLVSRSAPTASAVRFAQSYNITLLGYARGTKATIYSCPERIVAE